ncbi:helix-turn-helix domain-containing protein [Thalassoroseus pseudoceratinae]|uniref:helix-turn-helix domain-containing protein n=1 Tax=Thalassoroseus pseudoceratinae TaxID=2713176 RepID=UPI0014222275|nr:helix-turn-helix domain-containing protein [Thalassoroseus pseudoceratinae]
MKTEERRVQVSRMYAEGKTQAEIAEAVGVSQLQVCHDLKMVRRHWRESAIRDFDALRDEQLAKIDEAERRAWEVFERSCEDAVKTRREVGENGEFGTGYMERVGQTGDVRSLDLVLKCVERRCKLLGLDAPQKVVETDAAGNDLSAEERRERARQMLIRHGYRPGNIPPSQN